MKKYFLMAVLCMAVCVGVCSCGDDDDTPSLDKAMTEHLCGVEWKEYGTKRIVRMYRNHLVETWVSSKITAGALTYDDNTFYGVWSLTGDKLTTTFTAGNNYGFDQNMLMHGTMTIGTDGWNEWHGTDAEGEKHSCYYDKKSFTDYTDATAHDKALHGTWTMQANVNYVKRTVRLTMNKDGNARFEVPDLGIDFTTSYTTENGHVRFEHFVTEQTGTMSFIYLRDDKTVTLHEESKGVRVYLLEIQ